MPMQQGMQPQQQNNGYGLPMQPYGVNQQQQLQQGIQQPTIPMGQQRPDAAFQPYGVQPGQQQGELLLLCLLWSSIDYRHATKRNGNLEWRHVSERRLRSAAAGLYACSPFRA